eukprot:365415-Chlamydomonas_euryale.AAC.9
MRGGNPAELHGNMPPRMFRTEACPHMHAARRRVPTCVPHGDVSPHAFPLLTQACGFKDGHGDAYGAEGWKCVLWNDRVSRGTRQQKSLSFHGDPFCTTHHGKIHNRHLQCTGWCADARFVDTNITTFCGQHALENRHPQLYVWMRQSCAGFAQQDPVPHPPAPQPSHWAEMVCASACAGRLH